MFSPYAHVLVNETLRKEIADADERAAENRKRNEAHVAALRAAGVLNMDQLLAKHFGKDTPKELEVFRSPPKPQPAKQKEIGHGTASDSAARFPAPPRGRPGRG